MALFPCNIGSSGGTPSNAVLVWRTGSSATYTFTKDYSLIVACAADTNSAVSTSYSGNGTRLVNNYQQMSGAYVFSCLSVIANVKAGDTMHVVYNGMIWSLE